MKQENEKPDKKLVIMQIYISFTRERERERRAGFSHLQEDYAMPKLQIIAAMYVVYECVCECVCYGAYAQCPQTQKVTMTIIGEGSNVSNSTKKNLIII